MYVSHICKITVKAAQLCDSWRLRGPQPTRLLCPWDSPGKTTGVGGQSLLQGIFWIQGSKLVSCIARRILYCLSRQGSPQITILLF